MNANIHTPLHYICMFAHVLLWCVYAGSSLEIKIETDSNDAVEIKTEADSNGITEYLHHGASCIGMFGLYNSEVLLCINGVTQCQGQQTITRVTVP